MRIRILMAVFLWNTMTFCGLAQEFAVRQLEESPRHHEWVKVPSDNGRMVHSFVAYPEEKENAVAVIVIHENTGLTDWVRSFADGLAAKGYLAVAPDLLSGFDERRGRTGDFAGPDEAKEAIYQLKREQVANDLKAVQDYMTGMPSADGKIAVIGFCWGGQQAFQYAADGENLSGVFVFYGSPPSPEAIEAISAPVYGFYGENDQRINATIAETERLMKSHGKVYDYVIYPGAGHAFMRHGDDPQGSGENKSARDQAWARLEAVLSEL